MSCGALTRSDLGTKSALNAADVVPVFVALLTNAARTFSATLAIALGAMVPLGSNACARYEFFPHFGERFKTDHERGRGGKKALRLFSQKILEDFYFAFGGGGRDRFSCFQSSIF